MQRWLIAVACLVVGGCAAAGTVRPDPSKPVDVVTEVLRLSGTREATQSLEGALRRVLTALSGVETFRDPRVVAPIVDAAITANRIFAGLAAHFEEHFDAERLDRVVTLLRQPLSQRMVALEVAAITAPPETIVAWKRAQESTSEGRARFELARRIDAAAGATEATMGILYGAGRGAMRAFTDDSAPGARGPVEQLRAEMAKLEPETRAETVNALAYTYRDASLDEIRRYADLLETDLVRWFSRLQSAAAARVSETLSEAAIRRLMDARRAPRV